MDLITVIMLEIGMLFLLAAAIILLIVAIRKRQCTAKTDATITNIKRTNLGRHSYQVICRVTYEYYVNGINYIGTRTVYERNTPSDTTISIAYCVNNPKLSIIPNGGDRIYKITALSLAIVGLSVIFVFCAPQLINLSLSI